MPVTHVKSNTNADWSGVVTIGNSTGGTTTDQASNLVRPTDWNSNHAVNLSASEVAPVFNFGSGLTSTTAAEGISVGLGAENFYEPFAPPNTNSTVSAPGIGTWYLDPINIPFALSNGQIFMPVVGGASTNWPPVSEAWFWRLNKAWRDVQNYNDPDGYTCNFDHTVGYGLHPGVVSRNQEYQQHAVSFWKEAAQDLMVTLTKL